MNVSAIVHSASVYLPIANAIGIPIVARRNPTAAACLVAMAAISAQYRVTNKQVHDFMVNQIIQHENSTINPYKVINPPINLPLDKYKKCIIMFAPHGATFFSAFYIGAILRKHYGVINQMLSAPLMLKVPYTGMCLTSIGICTLNPVDPTNFVPFMEGDNGPYSIYHGAFDDIFDNSEDNSVITINVQANSLLFKIASKTGKYLVPVLIANETKIFTHNKYITKLFKYIHKNYIRTGMPIPPMSPSGLPFFCTTEPLYIICGDPITDPDPIALVHMYVNSMKELHAKAVESGYTNSPINIKLKGLPKL